MAKRTEFSTIHIPKTLLLAIHAPYHGAINFESYTQEFINLVKTNQDAHDELMIIKLRSIDSGFFLTKGKLEEVRDLVKKDNVEQVIISEPLTVQQERNLVDFLECDVIDRTRLILEIFEKAAHSAEGKLQVEIAILKHKKTRLAGRGVWLSQQGGRIGTRGPGETAKEKETRHIENTILKLERQLQQLEVTRATQRKRRLGSGQPLICLIGYTNAGKSTVLNALTKSDVLAENKLFATLDTTTRELYIDGAKKGLLSDTVGFIQNLPHQLINAFKSTLSELQYADLLLHIIDASDPSWPHHIRVVREILQELNIDKPQLYVFNKADAVIDIDALQQQAQPYQPHVIISATQPNGLQPLIDYLRTWHATSSQQ